MSEETVAKKSILTSAMQMADKIKSDKTETEEKTSEETPTQD